MSEGDRLQRYLKKRDFGRTGEPKGGRAKRSAQPLFVIQKHDASRLHYDFRLEIDGVSKSWAVPKGPSTDPRDKRLAVPTEDHPLAYAEFEGVIPEGEYGAGAVLVWDAGTYENTKTSDDGSTKPMNRCLEDGHLTFRLSGEKLRGGYALTRMKRGSEEKWLLVKTDDDEADARRNPVSTEPLSVLSGKDLDDIRDDDEA